MVADERACGVRLVRLVHIPAKMTTWLHPCDMLFAKFKFARRGSRRNHARPAGVCQLFAAAALRRQSRKSFRHFSPTPLLHPTHLMKQRNSLLISVVGFLTFDGIKVRV